jgi:CBS domain containing-hemolysin-like protein
MTTPFPYALAAMAILVGCSGFFSCSEAALFSLSQADRQRFHTGTTMQKLVAALLSQPDRLLTAVLFWNLVINITYFAIVSIIGIRLEQRGHGTEAGVFGTGALLVLIFFGEMLPKNLAVLQPRGIAPLVSFPVAGAARIVDPILPAMRRTTLVLRRIVWPVFEPEMYLDVADLQRAIELSTSDAALKEQEISILQNIVSLSVMQAEELMRPRTQFQSFRPPVSLEDLKGRTTASGYVLVSEPESDEIAAAVRLADLVHVPTTHIDSIALPVVYVPWCSTVDRVFERMRHGGRDVAAVVNEYGETIGILTVDDILDTVLGERPSRSNRLLQTQSIATAGPAVWHVTGMTGLKRLERHFQSPLPETRSVTVAGVLQEVLQRMPVQGDHCRWGPFDMEVLELTGRGRMLVELRLVPPPEEIA